MRLVAPSAGFTTRVGFGRYVWRRLVRAGFADLAASAQVVNEAVLTAGRAVEDHELPESEAIANRDADDDDLDDTAQLMRLQLASRSVQASRERPYTDIFPDGIEHYIAATLALQSTRYSELIKRTVEHLPETDPVRVEGTPKLEAQLASWSVSFTQVSDARNDLAIARTARDAAVDDWVTTMERIYGALVSKVGKRKAERFFPKLSRRRVASEEPEVDPDPDAQSS